MSDIQLLLVVYVASGLLLAALAVPMILGRVTPNWAYGFRVRKTLDNPEIWYKANRYAGRWLLASGVITVVSAVAFYFLPDLSVDGYALLCAAASLGALAVTVIMSFRYLKTL